MATTAPPIRTAPGAQPSVSEARVRGWKEIGRWFGVDERTVKRWEASRGLPIHRVPGEARAPVFAYEAELAQWLQSRDGVGAAAATPDKATPQGGRRGAITLVGIIGLVALAIAAWQGWQLAETRRQEASARTADVRVLARSQVAELSDRLERQPGTVKLRAELAGEAAAMLAKVAAVPESSPALRLEAAEAYRRLAKVQSTTDRPSLHDRAAARASLDKALAMIADDRTVAAGQVRAMLLIDAARHAAAEGALAKAPAMLKAAAAAAPSPPQALHDELLLAQSEIAQWQGNYPKAIADAEAVLHAMPVDAAGLLRQIKAQDLVAEAKYYAGDKIGALAGYRKTVAAAEAGAARYPDQPAFRWAVQRQQWNLGSTLSDVGQVAASLPILAQSRAGWMAMAAADPQDGSLRAWVRTVRLSYGEALRVSGQTAAAISELSATLAESRAAVMAQPRSVERQRSLIIALSALAHALGGAGRQAEACALFAEATAGVKSLATAGALTGLDKDSMLRELGNGSRRYCASGLTAATNAL